MQTPFTAATRTFLSRGRIVALAIAALTTVLFGLLLAFTNRSTCSEGNVEVACPADPVGPQGTAVSDQFFFAHRPLGTTGTITVRLTSMTGIITYPPPNHDEIVPGLVPWAKAGIMIKDGVRQGSSYAALMLTGAHGVHMQDDYIHDTAGSSGGASPRWLRLTRSGDTITGFESADGATWTQVGTAHLTGLPQTVQVGLFAASPGDLTLRPTGLGASAEEARFTQATGTFDNVVLDGAPAAEWRAEPVGGMGHTDWERLHRPPGLVVADGTLTVTGSGDVGPRGTTGGHPVEDTLVGLVFGLIIVFTVAARFATRSSGPLGPNAVVVGAAGFLTGLVTAAVAIPIGTAALGGTGSNVLPTSVLTELGLVVGVAGLVAVTAVLAFALGALLKRAWAAVPIAIAVIVVPYALAALPLFPDAVADWLLRLTPAAGFAVLQTLQKFPQVVAHYAPSAGYFPLPGWAGFAVLCAYTALALGVVLRRVRTLELSWR